MQDLKRSAALALAALCLALPAGAQVPAPVTDALRAAGLPTESLSVVVEKAGSGERLLAYRAAEPMQPASTLKVLTALVALEKLGPAWWGRTELVTDALVEDGVLKGDLVLRGGADPDMDWPRFRRMLLSLRNQGIRDIAGDLLLDLSLFTPARIDEGLPPFDETPEFRYNVIPDALNLGGYLMGLELSADKAKVSAAMETPLEGVRVANALVLSDRKCADWEDGWKLPRVEKTAGEIVIHLSGDFPKDCTASTRLHVLDRVDYADRLFRALWKELGGTYRGTTRVSPAPGGRKLAEHRSRLLGEMIRDVNKRSDNPNTRLLHLVLGTQDNGPAGGTTLERADRAVRAWMKDQSIDDAGLVLDNGSGLSRKERIRADQLAAVLQRARKSLWFPEFQAALPIAGVDGGVRRRLDKSPAAQRSRLKTGTLRDTSALAGYVVDAKGETLVFVAMINHPLAKGSVARPILDLLVDQVARGLPR
ncbi:MAG TPA: D-alanyl-D-alanine carboxypeptidase/D-alanyl-D-alanine-endopeptidase [Usitatibacteraceae bacterium]|nr:D-alanyl-D-alanine carboxypeptidase/D-alanyl-D-alanine-endopeptidase [Usitatibacteraceae bacterium]